MIKMNVSRDDIINSQETDELNDYLSKKGHSLKMLSKTVDGGKADLATSLAIGGLILATYPIIKDLIDWARPKDYSITINDGNISTTINNLNEEEYIKLLKGLNKEVVFIEVS